MKILTKKQYSSENCRLYVTDEINQEYVIVDHGHLFEKYGGKRFELHTITDANEPLTPVKIPWVLMDGEEGTVFFDNLTNVNIQEVDDLFPYYPLLPEALKSLVKEYGDKLESAATDSYKTCKEFLFEVEKLGYTFDYYLDAVPFDLRKMTSTEVGQFNANF